MKTRFGGVLLATVISGSLCAGCGGSSPDAKTANAASETEADSATATESMTPVSDGDAAEAAADDGWADDTATADNSPAESNGDGWAEPATASGAAADGEDSRTTQTIMDFVSANRQPVRDCVNAEQRKDPTLGGDLVLKFVLTPSGKVTRLSVNDSETTFRSEAATSCILGVVQTWQFPPSSKGKEMKVNYPFSFNARKK